MTFPISTGTKGTIVVKTMIPILFLLLVACSSDADEESTPVVQSAESSSEKTEETDFATEEQADAATEVPVADFIAEEFAELWEPWRGDLDGMIERRAIRVLVPFGGYQYYFVRGRPRGAMVEMLQKMEMHLNEELQRRHIKVYVVPIPVSRDHMLPYLREGHADLIAADLTVTEERKKQVKFSRPLLRHINEVVVTGPAAPVIEAIDDLAGQEIVVRESSSYFEHLRVLEADFVERGLVPPVITLADELLEAEDLLEMVNAGMIPMTVLDDYKAEFWAKVFPKIVVRSDLAISSDGVIAWAMPPESNELSTFVEGFLRKYGRGTLVGNDTFNRYLADAARVRCAMSPASLERLSETINWLKMYAEEYEFDWLMLAAQGYQESRLNQAKRSAAGALGVMQIKPSTAADRNVGIPDITILENNVHAGAKYMRFLSDRYFSNGIDEPDRWFFSLAAYNAGPSRVARLRKEAADNGLDRNRWFGHVEIIAARRIGRETVNYVSSIYKYYVGYKLSENRLLEEEDRHGTQLTACSEDDSA